MVSTSRRPAVSAARRVAAAWPSLSATAVLSLAVVSLAVAPLAGAAGAGAAGSGAHRAGSRGPTSFALESQSEWVVAPAGAATAGAPATPSSPFDLELSARGAPPGATVEVLLYQRLFSRYDFKNVVRNGPRGYPIATTSPVAWRSLTRAPRAGGVALDLSVVTTASGGQGTQLGLSCAPPAGSGTCTGVYPVVVELQRSSGQVLRRFTTFLTFVAGKSPHPLELSWVLPVTAPFAFASHPASANQALAGISHHAAAALEKLISQVRATPSVPVTLDVSPETLQALDAAGPGGRAAVGALAALSTDPATAEVLARPYVPVDPGTLAAAGEPTEILAQMAAGATVLHRYRVQTTAAPSPWVETGPVSNGLATGLAQVHASQLVLPDTDLASTSSATSSGTWVSTFTLGLGRHGPSTSVDAAETDTWLDGQFGALRGDPALAATQLLADLAMVHFERPNTIAVRGMVAVPPGGWVANPVFDRVLLQGLAQNPVVEPVTLSHFFTSVATGGPRQLGKSGTAPVMSRALARAVSQARVRLSAFDGAVAHHPPIESQLDHLLLASEAETLSPGQRATGLSTFQRLLTDQLGLVKFATGKTFTLTARTGWIPITVQSQAPYTVVGTLSVSGNKFLFPHGTHRILHLDHATTSSRVDVEARSSGDLPLYVSLTSRDGRLVIARDTLTVRSTATSLVGIALTAVALAVLLTWWARTWWSGRRRRRARRSRPAGSGATA